MKDEERQKIINLYHQTPRWTWERIAYEVYKENLPQVKMETYKQEGAIATTNDYETALRWYNEQNNTVLFKLTGNPLDRTFLTDPLPQCEFYGAQLRGVNEIEILVGRVPAKYIERVRLCVGRHLMNVCRAEETCPYKALLPEYELDIQEERMKK